MTTLDRPRTLNLAPMVSSFYILDKRQQVIPFEPNWAQTQTLDKVKSDYGEGRPTRIIQLKARQLGCSTVSEAIGYAVAQLFPNSHGAVVAHETQPAEYLFSMTKRFHETWPFSDGQARYSSRRNLVLSNGSTLYVMTAENTEAGRGRTYSFLHASEVAFWRDPVKTMLALNQAMPPVPGNIQILESTANGIGNYFEEEYWRAKEGKSDYTAMFFPWFLHYEYIPCQGMGCRDGTCGVCEKASKDLKPKDSEERELVKLGASKAHLAWRRWAIPNRTLNNIDLFHQEFPSCVVAGTRVGTDVGIIPIERVASEAKVATYGEIDQSHVQPPSTIYKMKTERGYELRGTFDHPIFTPSGVLVPLLASKDQTIELTVPRFAEEYCKVEWRELGVDCSVTVDEEWGRFLGLFMGDGCFSDRNLEISFDARDNDLIEDTKELFRRLFGVEVRREVIGPNKGGARLRVSRNAFRDLLHRLGVLKLRDGGQGWKRDICVPEIIWRSPQPVVREFLRGLFEADGFNGYGSPRVVLFSAYEEFLKDVQILLLGFGITAKRTRNRRRNRTHEYWANELTLRKHESIAFNERIGFLSLRKQGRVDTWKQRTDGRFANRAVPITLADKVISVEEDGFEATYDLTVVGGEAFDANGIKTHNTDREAFITSGVNAFNEIELRKVYEPQKPAIGKLIVSSGEVKFVPDADGSLKLYKLPAEDKKWAEYFIGADPSFGSVDGDFAAAQVVNRHNKEQVAVFRGKINPVSFADELAKLGKFFNTAMIACENEGGGLATQERLRHIYPRLFASRIADSMPGRDRSEVKIGWSTSWKTKPWLITKLMEAVERQKLVLHDEETFKEMRVYSFYGGKGYTDRFGPADENKGHDDLVMSLAIALTCESQEQALPAYEVDTSPSGIIWGERTGDPVEWAEG